MQPGEVFPGLSLTWRGSAHTLITLNKRQPRAVGVFRQVTLQLGDLKTRPERAALVRAVREVKGALVRRRSVVLLAEPEQLGRFVAAMALRHVTGFGPNVVRAMLADRGAPLTTPEYVAALQRTLVTRVPTRGS